MQSSSHPRCSTLKAAQDAMRRGRSCGLTARRSPGCIAPENWARSTAICTKAPAILGNAWPLAASPAATPPLKRPGNRNHPAQRRITLHTQKDLVAIHRKSERVFRGRFSDTARLRHCWRVKTRPTVLLHSVPYLSALCPSVGLGPGGDPPSAAVLLWPFTSNLLAASGT